MNRTALREHAFQLLYSLEMQKDDVEEQIKMFCENNEIVSDYEKAYIKDIIEGTKREEVNLMNIISENLKENWNVSRISKVNLTILKLAIYEILYKEIPFKAEINEAVELAKKFGDDNSKSFVHGILASVVKKNNIE